MAKKKKQVQNEGFTYDIYLNPDLWVSRRTVYTKPFSTKPLKRDDYLNYCSKKVIGSYFTKEKIEELKQELIQKIKDCDNPFSMTFVDHNRDCNVSEEELFNVE